VRTHFKNFLAFISCTFYFNSSKGPKNVLWLVEIGQQSFNPNPNLNEKMFTTGRSLAPADKCFGFRSVRDW
jgi:hypothetical protein